MLLMVDLPTPLALRHGAATPVCHSRRFGLQGRIHNCRDLVDFVFGLASPAGSDVPQPLKPLVTKALAPENYRVAVDRKPLRDRDIGFAGSGGQNDSAAQRHLLRSAVRCGPQLDLFPFDSGKLTCLAHVPA
jgi:hypothetical protein